MALVREFYMIKQRIENVKYWLEKGEAALVTGDANRLYLTGFNSSAGAVLITNKNAYFLVDFRYFEAAKSAVDSCEVLLTNRALEQIAGLCIKHKINKIKIESDCVSVSALQRYKKAFEGIEVLSDNRLSEKLSTMRSVKSKRELSLIRSAQELTDSTFSYILQRISENRTEREVMLDMEFYMRRLGSEGVAFDFIVVSGKNSSLPHGVPTDKKIEKGDFVTMDFGAVFGGYRSDMTRTVAVSNITDEQRRVYDTVLNAQNAALDGIRSGVACRDIDKIARDLIEADFKGCFGHGLGHSVGIEIHESPCFNTVCETTLREGMVLTVEPGIYLENKFGVRIEDMIVVTSNGYENLTHSNKNLIIL